MTTVDQKSTFGFHFLLRIKKDDKLVVFSPDHGFEYLPSFREDFSIY